MYCPLQEAYQIPTFVSRRKKACHPSQPQSQPQAQELPYDPYGEDEGLGGRAPAYRKYGREDFADGPTSSTRDNTGSQMIDSVAYKYASQASDMKHYESKYGLQFPNITEKFSDAPMSQVPSRTEQCAPKDTTYRIPLSEETKKAFGKALDVAVSEQQPGANTQWLSKPRVADMGGVSGYDDDLEQYLKLSDMRAAPMPTVSQPAMSPQAAGYDPRTSPFAEAMSAYKGQMSPPDIRREDKSPYAPTPSVSPSGATDAEMNSAQRLWEQAKTQLSTSDRLIELLLFILAGVIVIFLCEQLYRLAVMTGMRDTLEIIRPYIEMQASE